MVGRASSRDCATALRGLLVVAALLGLFAMHGLAAHGTGHDAHLGDVTAWVSADERDHSGHGSAGAAAAEVSLGYGVPDEPAPDQGLIGLAGVCLAVLLIGIVTVLLGRGTGLAAQLRAAAHVVVRPVRARRDRDPPCLFALSIQRC